MNTGNKFTNKYNNIDSTENGDDILDNKEKLIFTDNNNKIDYKDIIYTKYRLNNINNTCYVNSGLQILLHLEFFVKNIIKLNNIKNSNITYEFLDLLYSIRNVNIENNFNEHLKEFLNTQQLIQLNF